MFFFFCLFPIKTRILRTFVQGSWSKHFSFSLFQICRVHIVKSCDFHRFWQSLRIIFSQWHLVTNDKADLLDEAILMLKKELMFHQMNAIENRLKSQHKTSNNLWSKHKGREQENALYHKMIKIESTKNLKWGEAGGPSAFLKCINVLSTSHTRCIKKCAMMKNVVSE